MHSSILLPKYLFKASSHKSKVQLEEFGVLCKKLYNPQRSFIKGTRSSVEFESLQTTLEIKTHKFEETIYQYSEFLSHMPLIILLRNWLERQVLNDVCGSEILKCFTSLLENQIVPSHDNTGRVWDLELQRQTGHAPIIENIQNFAEWSLSEKEQVLVWYRLFAKYLATATFGFVPYYDP